MTSEHLGVRNRSGGEDSPKPSSNSSPGSNEAARLAKKQALELYPKNVKAENIFFRIIRSIAAFVLILVYTPLLWLLLPTRLFHPLLHALGVPERHYPVDWGQRILALGILWMYGVSAEAETPENVEQGIPTVYCYTHCSNIEALVISAYSPVMPKFIFKRELMLMLPPLFILAWGLGHVPLNRSNRAQAFNALDGAVAKLKTGRSIGIFPEGTRSYTGELQEFRKGAFYMSKQANVSVTPVIFTGTWLLWPPHRPFPNTGHVFIRFMKPIKFPSEASSDDRMATVRSVMVDEIARIPQPSVDKIVQPRSILPPVLFLASVFSTIAYYFFF